MNYFNHLLKISGLSNTEAAIFFDVRLDSVKGWQSGRRNVPPGILETIEQLVDRMLNAANQAIDAINEQHTTPTSIEIGYAADDHEAQTLGWPTASVHERVIALVAAQANAAGHSVTIVPRGSTSATAAAIDAHE